MSEISREEMVDYLMFAYGAFAHTIEFSKVNLAIRDLIGKMGEWQARIKEIEEIYYEGKDWDISSSIIREICDYGKERP